MRCHRCDAQIFELDDEGDPSCIQCGASAPTRAPTQEELDFAESHYRINGGKRALHNEYDEDYKANTTGAFAMIPPPRTTADKFEALWKQRMKGYKKNAVR